MQTELKLYRDNGDAYIPFDSARGCCQILEPISSPQSFRTIRGGLVSFEEESQLKYASTIECKDIHPIALDGIWPGMALWVECICPLITPQLLQGQKVQLKRPAVDNSLWVHPPKAHAFLLPEECFSYETREVCLPATLPKGYISYRALLFMMVQEYSIKTHEWEGETGWKMRLIEV